MKPAALLMAIQTLSLDYLEMFQVVINDKVSSLQTDEHTTTKNKEQAAKVGQEFLKKFPALHVVKVSNLKERIMSYIQDMPGCSKQEVLKALNITEGQWNVTIKSLRESGHVIRKGERKSACYFLPEASKKAA